MTADQSNEDLLFQVMLDLGIELSAKIGTKQIAGKTVHFVDATYLVACFDKDVNESTINPNRSLDCYALMKPSLCHPLDLRRKRKVSKKCYLCKKLTKGER